MKIAVISDIHGNMQALDAVLKNIEQEKCDKIFCLGDLALAGPEPSKTVDKIIELNKSDNFILIQGNTDEMLANKSDELLKFLEEKAPVMKSAMLDDLKQLTKEQLDFLNTRDKQKHLEINGVKILLVHGSPRKNNEDISANLPIEKVEEIISGVNEDIIFCGHTHVPCGYQTNTKQTVINVGSIGRPFSSEPKSCYAILDIKSDGSFEVKHNLVAYDFEKAAEIIEQRGYQYCEKLAEMLRCKNTERYPK